MSCMICGLLIKINEKQPYLTANIIKNINLQDIHKMFFWENLFTKEETVSTNMHYQLLKDDIFTNGSNQVKSIFDGVVLKIEDNSVLVLCDNGVKIAYEKMEHVEVKKDERILAGNTLGSMKESVVIQFMLKDKKITLQDAYKVNED